MIGKLLSLFGTSALLVAALISGYSAWATVNTAPPLAITANQNPTAEIQTTEGLTAEPRQQRPDVFYTAITARPVFAPQRRPITASIETSAPVVAPQPPVESPPVVVPPPQIALLGVMAHNQQNRALVSQDGRTPEWIDKETIIDGWEITAIGPDWLEISHETDTIRVEMYQ